MGCKIPLSVAVAGGVDDGVDVGGGDVGGVDSAGRSEVTTPPRPEPKVDTTGFKTEPRRPPPPEEGVVAGFVSGGVVFVEISGVMVVSDGELEVEDVVAVDEEPGFNKPPPLKNIRFRSR